MVVIVSHGDGKGLLTIGERIVSREEIEGCFAGAPQGVQVTIALTGCFTGLWASLSQTHP